MGYHLFVPENFGSFFTMVADPDPAALEVDGYNVPA